MKLEFRPLRASHKRKYRSRDAARFKADWNDTLKLLEKELEHLKAENVVLEVDVTESQISMYGGLKGRVEPGSPAVVLNFEMKEKNNTRVTLSYPCDTYLNWRHNVRAIALSLEALRAVDRYGVTTNNEQYTGWMSLPEPEGEMDLQEASEFLARGTEFNAFTVYNDKASRRKAFLKRAQILHPDKGGMVSDMQKLTAAYNLLERAFP